MLTFFQEFDLYNKIAMVLGHIVITCFIISAAGYLLLRFVVPVPNSLTTMINTQTLDSFGDLYENEKLSAYVYGVGAAVVDAAMNIDNNGLVGDETERFRFFVLDSDDPYAIALSHRKVYVTRGLLAILGDEDELASVIGRQIAHKFSGNVDERLQRIAAPWTFLTTLSGLFNTIYLNGLASGLRTAAETVCYGQFKASYPENKDLVSDRLAIQYLHEANYDVDSLRRSYEKIDNYHRIYQREITMSYSSLDDPQLRLQAVNREIESYLAQDGIEENDGKKEPLEKEGVAGGGCAPPANYMYCYMRQIHGMHYRGGFLRVFVADENDNIGAIIKVTPSHNAAALFSSLNNVKELISGGLYKTFVLKKPAPMNYGPKNR